MIKHKKKVNDDNKKIMEEVLVNGACQLKG
jgi:hypothetical protein